MINLILAYRDMSAVIFPHCRVSVMIKLMHYLRHKERTKQKPAKSNGLAPEASTPLLHQTASINQAWNMPLTNHSWNMNGTHFTQL